MGPVKKSRTFFVNGKFLTQKVTGVQRFASEVVRRLQNFLPRVEILAPPSGILPEYQHLKNVVPVGFQTGQFWEQIELPFYLHRFENPVLLNLCNMAPLLSGNNALVLHDVGFLRNPQFYTGLFQKWYSLAVPILVKRAKVVFTVSQFQRNEIAHYFPREKRKIFVVQNSVATNFQLLKKQENFVFEERPNDNFVLGVFSQHPQKNIEILLRALPWGKNGNPALYLVGERSPAASPAFSIGETPPGVSLLGRISDDELATYYKRAMLFVFPSFYEGFGIPPLEAQFFGCPVLLSDIPVFRELFSSSVLYFNPHSVDDLKEKLRMLVNGIEIRRTLAASGLENAKRYSWETSAQEISHVMANL